MKQLFVFDVDGTLYDLNDVVLKNYEIQVDFIRAKTGWAREKVCSYFSANNVFPKRCATSRSATELFLRDGYSREEWNAYREQRFPVECIDATRAVDCSVMTDFAQKGVCVLLSSNSYVTIVRILERINIPLGLFSSVFCSDRFNGARSFNKLDVMESLLGLYSVSADNMISIGDRFETDIRPALMLGGRGVLVKSPKSLTLVEHDFSGEGLRSCQAYEFFSGREALK